MEKPKQPKFLGLTKKFCKECFKKECENENVFFWWEEGEVFCWITDAYRFTIKPPPINCPYHLEHILNVKKK